MLTVGPLSATNSHTFIEQIQASIPVPVRWKDGKHIASRLLTPAENTKVFKILGSKRKALATTVAQMWFAIPKNSTTWTQKLFGVLCLVKDFLRKSYFIWLVDVSGELGIIHEQEIYRQFKYKRVLNTFHTFEGDYCTVGLNFCDMDEAAFFLLCVEERISFFKKKRAEVKARQEKRAGNISQNPTASDKGDIKQEHDYGTPIKTRKSSFSLLWNKILKNSTKHCVPTTRPKVKDTKLESEVSLMTFSSDEDIGRDIDIMGRANHGPNSYRCSIVRPNNIASVADDFIEDVSNDDDKRQYSPQPTESVFAKSVLPQAKNIRQQLRNNKAVAMFKEQQKEYHSAMIRSLVSSKDARIKQSKHRKSIIEGREGGYDEEYSPFAIAKSSPTDSTTAGEESFGAEWVCTSRSFSAVPSHLQFQKEYSAKSFNTFVTNAQPVASKSRGSLHKTHAAWRRRSFEQPGPEHSSSISIDAPPPPPPELTTLRSTLYQESASDSSFPSLPSVDKLQFPKAGYQMHGLEESRPSSQNSRGSLVATKDSSAKIIHTSNESSRDYSQSVSRDSKPNVIDLHDAVMKSILAGKKLRKVSPKATDPKKQTSEHGNVLGEILMRAVQERNKFLRNPSDDESENDDADEEWLDNSESDGDYQYDEEELQEWEK